MTNPNCTLQFTVLKVHKKEMYSEFLDVLEFSPKNADYRSSPDLLKDPICLTISQFLKLNVTGDQTHLCVSLSGGVDSMIIAICLKRLTKLKIIGAHVQYGNREESVKEAQFVELWCKDNEIIFEKESVTDFKRDAMDRNDYEEISRKLRFGLYYRLIEKYGCAGICLGHHSGDIAENVFTNTLHGRDLLDLEVIKPVSKTQDVNFWRPLVGCYKPAIFKFAEKFQIPYFKDTTPDWSNRGVLRRRIFPLLGERYGENFQKNLVQIGQQSSEWADLIATKIIDPFMMEHVKIGKFGAIIDFGEHAKSPASFWGVILRKVLHSLHHSMISHKTLDSLVEIFHSNKRNCQFMLAQTTVSYITDHRLMILLPQVQLMRASITTQSINQEIDFDPDSDEVKINGVKTIKLAFCDVTIQSMSIEDSHLNQSDLDWDYINGKVSYSIPASAQLLVSNKISQVDSTTKMALSKLSKCLHASFPVVSLQKGASNASIPGYFKITIQFASG
jgi:tRNA(Ile)-lysidine synthetase-like protein